MFSTLIEILQGTWGSSTCVKEIKKPFYIYFLNISCGLDITSISTYDNSFPSFQGILSQKQTDMAHKRKGTLILLAYKGDLTSN